MLQQRFPVLPIFQILSGFGFRVSGFRFQVSGVFEARFLGLGVRSEACSDFGCEVKCGADLHPKPSVLNPNPKRHFGFGVYEFLRVAGFGFGVKFVWGSGLK